MEEVLLLGIKDKQGYLSFWNDNISYALGGHSHGACAEAEDWGLKGSESYGCLSLQYFVACSKEEADEGGDRNGCRCRSGRSRCCRHGRRARRSSTRRSR
ncbi:hypothetical protein FB451DRAFT_1272671 [Mycena latifolia]|nr:hypothetical protein FB451DRAFT_1272671 [Mycena latifolia]